MAELIAQSVINGFLACVTCISFTITVAVILLVVFVISCSVIAFFDVLRLSKRGKDEDRNQDR